MKNLAKNAIAGSIKGKSMKTRLILVGGFLGAGKTTLLWELANTLTKQGNRIGLITNDQASSLVDTAFLEHSGGAVHEVSGSCFCCNFNGLTDAILSLKTKNEVNVIIAEPVGSCTDLCATLMQPLKQKYQKTLNISPLTVLVDPKRLEDIVNNRSKLHPSATYIVKKQLEEADIIAISKTDLLTPSELEALKISLSSEFPLAQIFALSAKNSEGIEAWLSEITNRLEAGEHLVEVDYDIYAEGEAVLGWLNTTIMLQGHAIHWDTFAEKLLRRLAQHFDASHLAVGHVKLLIDAQGDQMVGNLTGNEETLNIRGHVGVSDQAKMILNARVETSTHNLEQIVTEAICNVCGDDIAQRVKASKCLQPGRPNPTHRFNYVVK